MLVDKGNYFMNYLDLDLQEAQRLQDLLNPHLRARDALERMVESAMGPALARNLMIEAQANRYLDPRIEAELQGQRLEDLSNPYLQAELYWRRHLEALLGPRLEAERSLPAVYGASVPWEEPTEDRFLTSDFGLPGHTARDEIRELRREVRQLRDEMKQGRDQGNSGDEGPDPEPPYGGDGIKRSPGF